MTLAIIQAAGSIILLGVTTWYAVLTRSMAKAAVESAKSSSEAAQSAATALAISAATVNVDFEISPAYYYLGGQEQMGVTLRSAGATVWVHRARLKSANRSTAYLENYGENYAMVVGDRELRCESGELPARLHRGEDLSFLIYPDFALRQPEDGVASMEATVWYSLDGVGPGVERQISYRGVVGRDYPDPGPEGLIDFPDHGETRD
jgi:hypothetical protein